MSCEKTRYKRKKALTVMNRILANPTEFNAPVYLRTYYCYPCHAWHLTSQHKKYKDEKTTVLRRPTSKDPGGTGPQKAA